MRVGVNVRVLSKPGGGGVKRYTRNLVHELCKKCDGVNDLEIILFGINTVPETLQAQDGLELAETSPPSHSGAGAHLWEQVVLPLALRKHNLDVFHTPAGQSPLWAPVPLVTTIHDISPVVHPEWFTTKYSMFYKFLTPVAIRASERIIVVSQFVKDELVNNFPEAAGKSIVVYNGVTDIDLSSSDQEPPESMLGERFLLFVGANNPRKNLSRTVEAYEKYRQTVDNPAKLVLVGPDDGIFAATPSDERKGIVALGHVPDETLSWLYDHAVALVFPSLYEGFGLPILEAMRAGTPVITSDQGAMSEIANDAAYLVDPKDVTSLAEAMRDMDEDPSLRERLATISRERSMDFDWTTTANKTIECYREAARNQ